MHKLNSKLENEIISLRERLDELCQRELKPRLTEGKIVGFRLASFFFS